MNKIWMCFPVAVLLLACSYAETDETEETVECFTKEWALGLVPCFTDKFKDLIAMIPEGTLPIRSSTGRSLKSAEVTFPRSKPTKGKLMFEFTNTIHGFHGEFQQMMVEALAGERVHGKEARERERILRRLRNIKTDEVLQTYSNEMVGLAVEFRDRVSSLAMSTVNADTYITDDIKDVIQGALDALCGKLIPQDVCDVIRPVLSCLGDYEIEDFEDNIKWAKCFYQCADLPVLSQCMRDQFEGCSLFWPIGDVSGLADIVTRAFVELMELDQCYFNFLEPTNTTETITLEEGGAAQYVQFQLYVPPAIHCLNLERMGTSIGFLKALLDWLGGTLGKCDVKVQLSTYTYLNSLTSQRINIDIFGTTQTINIGRPTCRSRAMLTQAVVGWHDQAVDSSCDLTITDTNWNETFVIPIRAALDSKADGNIDGEILKNGELTFKLRAGVRTKTTVKIPMEIIDMDVDKVSQCSILTDPHIITFDQLYFNNYYEGHFQLYKHNTLAYEVQAVFQRCSTTADVSCTCGVAVRSGDDVFVVDRCRREGETDDDVTSRVIMYVNGEVTQATRVFRRDEGLRYDVLLPQGTMVKVINSDNNLNVFIKPSASDRDQSTGLCGIYNSNNQDDLTYPDGSTQDTGSNNIIDEQPRDYIQAWRVGADDKIFWGAVAGDENTDVVQYCHCHHVLLIGVQCSCGYDHLFEACDIDTDGELTDNMTLIIRSSVAQYLSSRGESNPDTLDVDDTFEPADYVWESDDDKTEVEADCKESIETDPMLAECKSVWSGFRSDPFLMERTACMDDYLVTNSTYWNRYSREAAKERCRDKLYLSNDYSWEQVEEYEILSCLNGCHDMGTCTNGTCECDSDRTGPDCSQVVGETPHITMLDTTLCDTSDEDCSIAKLYGHNLLKTYELMCFVEYITKNDDGSITTGDSEYVESVFIGPSQLACSLPDATSMYRVSAYTDAVSFRTDNNFWLSQCSTMWLPFNSICYTCDDNLDCSRKTAADHCLVNSVCYAPDDVDPDNDCMWCDPAQLTDDWSVRPTDACHDQHAADVAAEEEELRANKLRYITATILSIAVIITAIVLYVLIGNIGRENAELKKKYVIKINQDNVVDYEKQAGVMNHGFDKKQTIEIESGVDFTPTISKIEQENNYNNDGSDSEEDGHIYTAAL